MRTPSLCSTFCFLSLQLVAATCMPEDAVLTWSSTNYLAGRAEASALIAGITQQAVTATTVKKATIGIWPSQSLTGKHAKVWEQQPGSLTSLFLCFFFHVWSCLSCCSPILGICSEVNSIEFSSKMCAWDCSFNVWLPYLPICTTNYGL